MAAGKDAGRLTDRETVERFGRARSDPSLAVLEGFHPLKHALRFGAEVGEAVSPDPSRVRGLAAELAPDLTAILGTLLTEVTEELYRELSPRPPDAGVIALARRPSHHATTILADPSPGPVVLLEEPTHLGNLGAAVRVAAAVGAAGLLATGEHDPWHASALRGSAGLHFALPVVGVDALPEALGDRPLVAVDPEGEPLQEVGVPDRVLLAFGSERRGLSPDLLERADRRVRIPMEPGVSSLNLATSVAVVLYACRLGLSPTRARGRPGR